jgi:perosamine synthetase
LVKDMNTWRMGVPVATPIAAREVFSAARALFSREDHRSAFESEVRDYLDTPFVSSVNSGRAALFLLLQAMKQHTVRNEVVIPAYVCPSVGRAVVKAGLKPVLCDVGTGGSGLDLRSLKRVSGPRTLAVVTAYLYGYPVDIAPVVELAHACGALVIEDAAQAFGATWDSQPVGTLADAAVFSFAMSKVLGCMGGGLITTSDPELQRRLDRSVAVLPDAGFGARALAVVKLAVVSLLVRSRNLGPLAAIWGGVLRGRNDCDDFQPTPLPASNASVLRALLSRVDEINAVRVKNGLHLSAHLSSLDGLILPEAPGSIFLRLPVIVRDLAVKKRVLAALRASGINVSEMYSRPSYEALRQFAARESDCPTTEYLAEHMLNLPTHLFVTARDLDQIVSVFQSALPRRQAVRRPVCVQSTP